MYNNSCKYSNNCLWLKELSVAVWFLWAPVNTGTQVCTLGKWAETQPHSLSPPFSTVLSTQLSSIISTTPHPIYPFRPWWWHSSYLQLHWPGFPECHDPAQARSWRESQRHLARHYLRLFNLCLQRETTWGSRDRHLIFALPDLGDLCYFVPRSLNWAKWMKSSFHDRTVYLTQVIPELCTQQSQQKPSLVTLT